MFIRLRDGLHQVHALCIDLDEGKNVSLPDSLVQNLQPGSAIGTRPHNEALLRVLGCDVVLPHLPVKEGVKGGRPTTQHPHLLHSVFLGISLCERHLHVTGGIWFGHILL